MKKKIVITVIAAVLVLGCAVGGTIAWLVQMRTLTNTFLAGNIEVELTESTGSTYQLIPGATLAKNPKVTVKHGSEPCWLFVKIEEAGTTDAYLSYEVAEGWAALDGVAGVYYREVPEVTLDHAYFVLKDNVVHVSDAVTKDEMDALTDEAKPKLTFTAYAVQRMGFDAVVAAWAEAEALV